MNTSTNYIHLIAQLRYYADQSLPASPQVCGEVADALERALPAITSWNSPDALRTRISMLTQNPYSPTDSIDSPQPEAT